jgi:hypothetical protein
MGKIKQPNPIDNGWEEYKELVHTHLMTAGPKSKCLTHEDCHLNSFYPGKHYRNMKMKRNKDGVLVIDKKNEQEQPDPPLSSILPIPPKKV